MKSIGDLLAAAAKRAGITYVEKLDRGFGSTTTSTCGGQPNSTATTNNPNQQL